MQNAQVCGGGEGLAQRGVCKPCHGRLPLPGRFLGAPSGLAHQGGGGLRVRGFEGLRVEVLRIGEV
jgi:hypothetical protein